MSGTCLFCNGPEKAYNPSPDVEFVCSTTCTQHLLNADQEDLNRAHTKAIEKGYHNKAKAIEFFIVQENPNGQRKPKTRKHERHTNRTRIVRPTRNQKKPVR
jgi:hypothetical protein